TRHRSRELVQEHGSLRHDDLTDPPSVDGVAVPRHVHAADCTAGGRGHRVRARRASLQSRPMSAAGIFRPPAATNEPVKTDEPGSAERAELQARLDAMAGERLHVPMVIGGERIESGTTFEAVMPHDRAHVLADVEKGSAEHVARAIGAARDAHPEWSGTPWHERVAVFLRAAELVAGPWRQTLN